MMRRSFFATFCVSLLSGVGLWRRRRRQAIRPCGGKAVIDWSLGASQRLVVDGPVSIEMLPGQATDHCTLLIHRESDGAIEWPNSVTWDEKNPWKAEMPAKGRFRVVSFWCDGELFHGAFTGDRRSR